MRRLILCCDGTWNRADWEGGTATNVIRIARAIKPMGNGATPADPQIPQIVYYHPGVGTGDRVDRLLGGGLGLGLSQHVRDAYAFIINNYVQGDEIFLFGFSRGAFTARTIAGLIGTIGLLSKDQMGAFMDAWAYHRLRVEEREKLKAEFAAHFPNRLETVPIRCIAVWDTVGALGVPENVITGRWQPCKSQYKFHNVELGDHVAYAFQALAIDEERRPFHPVVWTRSATARSDQTIRQMWFAGVHSDIGGGYVAHGASDVALLWIASELVERGLLDLDRKSLAWQLDRSLPYGKSLLNDSFSFLYRLSGRCHRLICQGPSEFIHPTVVARVMSSGYRDQAFLAAHEGRIAQLSEFESSIGGYLPEPFKVRTPFLRETQTVCERLVRWLLGQ